MMAIPLIAAAALAAEGASFEVALGTGRLLPLPSPVATLFVADPKIADVEARSPTLLYVYGKAVGDTSLIAVDRQNRTVASLRLTVAHDRQPMMNALSAAIPDGRFRLLPVADGMLLAGEVGTPAEAADAVEIVARSLPGGAAKLMNRLSVRAAAQINLRVRIAEVSRDIVRQLGVNWQAIGTFGSGVAGIFTGRPLIEAGTLLRAENIDTILGGVRNGTVDINVALDALDRRGMARILAEPNLTALSGEPASFLAGGEYPIPVPQGNNVVTIEYKRFGVSLDFVATLIDGGRINLAVRPEVSQLSSNGSIRINGFTIPALTTRRAETTVDLGAGQSFAIAGLLQSREQKALRKFPGLGNLPVIGELFRSREFERNETELVIIVTPWIVAPVHGGKLSVPGEEER